MFNFFKYSSQESIAKCVAKIKYAMDNKLPFKQIPLKNCNIKTREIVESEFKKVGITGDWNGTVFTSNIAKWYGLKRHTILASIPPKNTEIIIWFIRNKYYKITKAPKYFLYKIKSYFLSKFNKHRLKFSKIILNLLITKYGKKFYGEQYTTDEIEFCKCYRIPRLAGYCLINIYNTKNQKDLFDTNVKKRGNCCNSDCGCHKLH